MLTETAVSTILTASIAGAGLILAIYALITPMARKIFEERVKLHRKKKKEFDKLKAKISSESSKEDFKQLKTLAKEIQDIRSFPKYLSYGVLLVFASYSLTALFALGCITAPPSNKPVWDFLTLASFIISMVGFGLLGIYAILDVFIAMKGEFDQLKKEKEEVEKTLEEKLTEAQEVIEGFLTTYRRRKGKDTWHWCRNCSTYPTEDYAEVETRPVYGELCNECKAKEKANNCT